MKKVLILAYDFPPYVSVGGLRPYSWYKHFREFGLDPVVVTRQWGNKYGNALDYIAPGESNETIVEESEYGTILRTPYKPNLANRLMLKYGDNKYRLLRKSITAWYELMQFVFFVGPKAGLYLGAKDYIKNHKVDVIIATGSPHVLFKYASKLSKKYNIPWIADYRDPLSQSQSRNRYGWLKYWNRYFEKRFLNNVSFITVASEFVKGKVATLLNDKQFKIILNGYDSIYADKARNIDTNPEYLSLAFIGTIYKWHPIESVLITFADIIKTNPQINLALKFFGTNLNEYIKQYIQKELPEISHLVYFIPRIKNEELLPVLAKEHLMLLFNDYSLIGTKIYDYIGIKRKILLCYSQETVEDLNKLPYYQDEIESISNHVQQDLIKKTNSGIIIKDREELSTVLLELYSEFKKYSKIPCNSVDTDFYSRKSQAGVLCSEIKNLNCTNE